MTCLNNILRIRHVLGRRCGVRYVLRLRHVIRRSVNRVTGQVANVIVISLCFFESIIILFVLPLTPKSIMRSCRANHYEKMPIQ